MKNKKHIVAGLLLLSVFIFACKKSKKDAHIPPTVQFKTGAAYTSTDKTVHKLDTLLVGIEATKTEDDLKSYNASFIYDGGTASTTYSNEIITTPNAYSKDINIITRNQTGTEKWIFSIVDRDGNITQKTLLLTVQ